MLKLTIIILCTGTLVACTVPPTREVSGAYVVPKVHREEPAPGFEVFTQSLEEPQPLALAILRHRQVVALLNQTPEARDPAFDVTLSGVVLHGGGLSELRARGCSEGLGHALENALARVRVESGRPGPFRLRLTSTPGPGRRGLLLEPQGLSKKFE